jgi:hypothetical protein
MQFSNFTPKQGPSQGTATYTFVELAGEPSVEVRPASRANKEYFNALLRRMGKLRKSLERGDVTVEMLDKQDRLVRDLYADHVVVSLSGWCDSEGEEVPSNAETIKSLMEQLPDAQFEDLAEFATDEDNFRG